LVAERHRRHDRWRPRGGRRIHKTKAIFPKIHHLVEAAGGSMADVTKMTIFVTHPKQREKIWQACREFFTGNFPARLWCR
jgi:2-iminobutanoate/2-iminopropanoate deaminase